VADVPVLEVRGARKSYGQVEALRGVDFTVHAGEVVALIGDNGAGKSTLTKIISGSVQPDSGELLIDGRPVTVESPLAARDLGIETIYQDLALAPSLDTPSNLFLGRELVRGGFAGRLGFLDKKAMRAETARVYEPFRRSAAERGRSPRGGLAEPDGDPGRAHRRARRGPDRQRAAAGPADP
jgi:simple sugar transport system ATP-binding protein